MSDKPWINVLWVRANFDDGKNGIDNHFILTSTGIDICNINKYIGTRKVKKEDYDEATGYLLEALAIADSQTESFLEVGLNPLSASAHTYYFLAFCEFEKEGKRNLGKALDYLEKGSLMMSKIDPTDILIQNAENLSKTIKRLDDLSSLI